MTLKEKVAEMEPDAINEEEPGGVMCCPGDYEYLNDRKSWENCVLSCPTHEECGACWNREFVPVEEEKERLIDRFDALCDKIDCYNEKRTMVFRGLSGRIVYERNIWSGRYRYRRMEQDGGK